MLSLYNTLSREKTPFTPRKKGEVSIYSCGPTVYNRVHIGNIRAVLFCDTLQRWFRFGEGIEPKWVMNITDVDDKTIRDAKIQYPDANPQDGLRQFTSHYAEVFFEDIKKVGVDKCHLYSIPYATHYIKEMQELIQKIVDNGYGYVSEGSVYLDVQKYRKDYVYGKLTTLNFDDMQSTSRVDSDEYEKESVSDFVLWKAKKSGEPFWDFKLTPPSSQSLQSGQVEKGEGEALSLPGRPGWHIECSAMSKSLFPDFPFDIHTGGVDLCFPHHEDEICQAQAGYGVDTARFWCHNEHLMVEGKKMSKSLGNFYTLEDLEKKGVKPEVVRFFLVTNHYRTKVNMSQASLDSAERMMNRITQYKWRIAHCEAPKENTSPELAVLAEKINTFRLSFMEAMRDDLNVSVALAKFFAFIKEMSSYRLSHQIRQEVKTNVLLV